jgi:aspartokinase-like uncharacterized kinase
MIVVKVGGSLYDHPRLAHGLQQYLETLPEPVLLVPGGGPFADAVRQVDHQLDDDAAHLLALLAMNLAGEFLKHLGVRVPIVDAVPLGVHLPPSWNISSDSIAAHAAFANQASRLILLKSIDIPSNTSWEVAAGHGWVDPHFPSLVVEDNLKVEAVNFRRMLDAASQAGE